MKRCELLPPSPEGRFIVPIVRNLQRTRSRVSVLSSTQFAAHACCSDPPYTGWDGDIPSKEGVGAASGSMNGSEHSTSQGTAEEDFIHKPPYNWNSDKFKA